MKKIVLNLKQDREAFLFAVIGLLLIAFPDHVAFAIPYMLGIGSIVYACINIFISLKYPDSDAKLGDGIIKGVIGGVCLFLEAKSLSILGVIWAVQSLTEVAEEIEEFRTNKTFSPLSCISMVISIVLAVMLMMDPFEHFSVHVQVLGLEIIASVFIRSRRIRKAKVTVE